MMLVHGRRDVLFMAVPMGLQWHLFHLLFRCGACG